SMPVQSGTGTGAFRVVRRGVTPCASSSICGVSLPSTEPRLRSPLTVSGASYSLPQALGRGRARQSSRAAHPRYTRTMTVGPAKELARRGRGFWETVQRTRVWRTFSHFIDVGGPVLSGGMSYQALFAVFAGLLVGLGIFGMVLRNQEELLDTIVVQLNLF